MSNTEYPHGKGFYMIWKEGSSVPSRQHATYEEARKEAVRLSEKHIGSTFHILKAQTRFYTVPMNMDFDNCFAHEESA